MKRKLAEAAAAGKKGRKAKKGGAAAAAAPAPAPAAAPAMPAVFTTYERPAPPAPSAGGGAAAAPAMAPPSVGPAAYAPSVSVSSTTRYAGAAVTGLRTAPPPASTDFPSLGAALAKPAPKKDADWEKVGGGGGVEGTGAAWLSSVSALCMHAK